MVVYYNWYSVCMNKGLLGLLFLSLTGILMSFPAMANNVRVVGDVVVDPLQIKGNVATVNVQIEWDNSWRDEYNHDAVYFFLKYQVLGEGEAWHHVYLMDDGHNAGNGYECVMAKSSGKTNHCEGIFIQRKNNGVDRATVNLTLKWDFTQNTNRPLQASLFSLGHVSVSAMAVEMVYIPRGAFHVGDNYSNLTFRHHNVYIPDRYNLVDTMYRIDACNSNEESQPYPARNAAIKFNDVTNANSNAWVGNGNTHQWWRIDFEKKADGTPISPNEKSIKYISIEGRPGYVPVNWRIEGARMETGANIWTTVCSNTTPGAEIVTSLTRTYPGTKAFKVENTGPFRFYRLYIDAMPGSQAPVIKSISMTDQDLAAVLDYSVVIDRTQTTLNSVEGISVEDGDTWAEVTDKNFPNGYKAFYVMKYEVSQEQYVAFLNTLPYAAQQARTIGAALSSLSEGSYVFGSKPGQASTRNGIILASKKGEGEPVLFACDLDKTDGEHSLAGDGQSIACNFLSIEDMMAYADWAGLRPLSEMEYEKISRQPYPTKPLKGEFAWNDNTTVIFPEGLSDGGMKSEVFTKGNVNAGNKFQGPVRCGIFAGKADRPSKSGASFWGIMELCGNLSEVYYNAGSAGRKFRSMSAAHGDGVLGTDGKANVTTTYWPTDLNAFALRGGNFTSDKEGIMTSNRKNARGYFKSLSQRDSTVSFRLGYSFAEYADLQTALQLENGSSSVLAGSSDTICSGAGYHIAGDLPEYGGAFYTFIWYVSENKGKTWEILEGENGQNLDLTHLFNQGTTDLKEYRYKRKFISSIADGETGYVSVFVINADYRINYMKDTVICCNESRQIEVTTDNDATFEWTYNGKKLEPVKENARMSAFRPRREDFVTDGNTNLYGDKMLEVSIKIQGRCMMNEAIELFLPQENYVGEITIKQDAMGYRQWSDGTCARSAYEYRHPKPPYCYIGDVGSGVYRIDPDGFDGPIPPFNVWCDMETDEGGWMLCMTVTNAQGATASWWNADASFGGRNAANDYFTNATCFGNYAALVKENAKSQAFIYHDFDQILIKEDYAGTKGSKVYQLAGKQKMVDRFKRINNAAFLKSDVKEIAFKEGTMNTFQTDYLMWNYDLSGDGARLATNYGYLEATNGISSRLNGSTGGSWRGNITRGGSRQWDASGSTADHTAWFFVRLKNEIDRTDKEVIKIKLNAEGHRSWDNGTYARSADEYRNPQPPYYYSGNIGDGVYRIDPDGVNGPIQPFDVYCDMETGGGGWMLCMTVSNNKGAYVDWWDNDASVSGHATTNDYFTNDKCFGNYRAEVKENSKTPVFLHHSFNQIMIKENSAGTVGMKGLQLKASQTMLDRFKQANRTSYVNDASGVLFYSGTLNTFAVSALMWNYDLSNDGARLAAMKADKQATPGISARVDGSTGYSWKGNLTAGGAREYTSNGVAMTDHTAWVFVREKNVDFVDLPTKITIANLSDGKHAWSDGSCARTAYEYLYPPVAPYTYEGVIGNGNYTIDPDGYGGIAAYSANCNMTGGGWTQFTEISTGWSRGTSFRVTNLSKFTALGNAARSQRVNVAADVYSNSANNNSHSWYRYDGSCVPELYCGSCIEFSGDRTISLNYDWAKALYKTYYQTIFGPNSSENGMYLGNMWFQ